MFRYTDIGAATSVYNRSVTCDIELPEYSSISMEEESYPLAYAITAYMDSRNLELLLASIFRPHNSYCLHIDPLSDELFRWENIIILIFQADVTCTGCLKYNGCFCMIPCTFYKILGKLFTIFLHATEVNILKVIFLQLHKTFLFTGDISP